MASQVSTGSPKLGRKSTANLKASDEVGDKNRTPHGSLKATTSKATGSVPQHVNNLSNIQASQGLIKDNPSQHPHDSSTGMNTILAQLRGNDTRKISPHDAKQPVLNDASKLDKLMSNLNNQHKVLKKQEQDLREGSNSSSNEVTARGSSDSDTQPADVRHAKQVQPTAKSNDAEIERIKQELEAARSLITRQEQELAESRNLKHTMEQALGTPSEADFPTSVQNLRYPGPDNRSAFNASAMPFTARSDASWTLVDDVRSEQSAKYSNAGHGRTSFSNPAQGTYVDNNSSGYSAVPYTGGRDHRMSNAGYNTTYGGQTSPMDFTFGARAFSGSSNTSFGIDERMLAEHVAAVGPYPSMRRNPHQLRINPALGAPISPVLSAGMGTGHSGHNAQYGYQDRGYVGPVSPVSPEFPPLTGGGQGLIPTSAANGGTYMTTLEPMNYRRLLDKSVSCDWKYIVDKIVCNNDQQASIFLQQKLKVGTAEQKFEIVEAIVNQAYPLMINRFGNFLIQRCFEHGTPEQVVAIANSIHGNVISLSMDPFGCHVIQKSFDSVPEDHKADMVRELLRRIPDTVIHRYACHVWQKLFELRWSGEPPQIMLKVNEALRGMWHEVALGETGSLVVQNIFENCVEEEKRPAIEEVVSNIDLIAHGQFGNWCIQHLCEHGAPPDRRRVIDHILNNAYSYSIDQFASKVVEKCLKISGSDFLDRYLGVITTARPDRPRIPLIDIAGDQYGNYLIQWILTNTHQHQREQVGIHIRKHMVSLRGSKFGSRVAMLCSNPAAATRPGPTPAMVTPYGAPGAAAPAPPSRSGWTRYR